MSHEVESTYAGIESELYGLRQREIEQDILSAEHVAWSGRLCPDCGNPEGMASYDRQAVRFLMKQEAEYTFPPEWYVAADQFAIPTAENHELWRRCGTCRPVCAPVGWLQVPEEYAKLWAVVPCVCPDCTREVPDE
jgi:hypothetical protein